MPGSAPPSEKDNVGEELELWRGEDRTWAQGFLGHDRCRWEFHWEEEDNTLTVFFPKKPPTVSRAIWMDIFSFPSSITGVEIPPCPIDGGDYAICIPLGKTRVFRRHDDVVRASLVWLAPGDTGARDK